MLNTEEMLLVLVSGLNATRLFSTLSSKGKSAYLFYNFL